MVWISACSLSRMLFAMAVPSILVAVMAIGVEENCLFCGTMEGGGDDARVQFIDAEYEDAAGMLRVKV